MGLYLEEWQKISVWFKVSKVQGLENGRGAHWEGGDSVYPCLTAVHKEMHIFVRAFSLFGCTLIWIPMLSRSVDRLPVL